jgi:hypothetical protein
MYAINYKFKTFKSMKVNLLQKIAAIATLNLEFVGLDFAKSREGQLIGILQLAEPKEYVRGSQEVEHEGKRTPIVATDVFEVKIHEKDMEDEGFEFDTESDTGTYNGKKLQLDVSKGGTVWLTSTPFSAAATEFKNANRNKKTADLIKRQVEKQKGVTKLVDTEN